MKNISRTVWVLSLVSLFTDMASEMLYPVLPIYLKSIGFSVVLIGVLEGIAEAVAGLSKGYFGKLSDNYAKRVPFVQLGYTLSAISKPMMAFFIFPIWIFFARTVDRLGKGIRTGARDALLSAESTVATKGTIFGFHRSMDTLGAALGPALALLYLYIYPENYITLFYLAFIPGMLAIGSTFLLKEKPMPPSTKKNHWTSFFSFLNYWKQSPSAYRQLVTGLLFFALINSSDVFLLLKLKAVGFSDVAVIGIYIFYNLVFALFAFPIGILADKIGLKKIFLLGLLLFCIVYLGMAITSNTIIFLILFSLYGLFAAATEGVSKAWISNISAPQHLATAIGTYTAFQSICALLASSFAGFIWYQFGAAAVFWMTGLTCLLVIGYFLFVRSGNESIS